MLLLPFVPRNRSDSPLAQEGSLASILRHGPAHRAPNLIVFDIGSQNTRSDIPQLQAQQQHPRQSGRRCATSGTQPRRVRCLVNPRISALGAGYPSCAGNMPPSYCVVPAVSRHTTITSPSRRNNDSQIEAPWAAAGGDQGPPLQHPHRGGIRARGPPLRAVPWQTAPAGEGLGRGGRLSVLAGGGGAGHRV